MAKRESTERLADTAKVAIEQLEKSCEMKDEKIGRLKAEGSVREEAFEIERGSAKIHYRSNEEC